jgi:hypothetical protein
MKWPAIAEEAIPQDGGDGEDGEDREDGEEERRNAA